MGNEKIKFEYEPYNHKGMKISFNGMMTQVMNQLQRFEKFRDNHTNEDGEFSFDSSDIDEQWQLERLFSDLSNYSYTIEELLKHFKILGEAFYKRDGNTVDNVLQLWCLKPKNKENKNV